jgi:predicted RNase H-like HicB family nuclease
VSKTAGYIALVHKDEGTSYGVSFPDVPGCISAGDTFEQAIDNASEALAGHLSTMEADGESPPEARTIEELKKDKDFVNDSADAIVAFVAPRSDQVTTLQFDITSPSSAIKEVAYELSKRELLITFVTGRRSVYDDVPLEVVEAFKAAASHGSFFDEEISSQYPHREFSERFLIAANG